MTEEKTKPTGKTFHNMEWFDEKSKDGGILVSTLAGWFMQLMDIEDRDQAESYAVLATSILRPIFRMEALDDALKVCLEQQYYYCKEAAEAILDGDKAAERNYMSAVFVAGNVASEIEELKKRGFDD